MSWYSMHPSEGGEGARHEAQTHGGGGLPLIAGILRAVVIGLIVAAVVMGMGYANHGEKFYLVTALSALGGAVSAWAARTVIVLLVRIARALEKNNL